MLDSSDSSNIEIALLSAIRQFFEERTSRAAEPEEIAETVGGRPLQLATTVLFLQMIRADQESRHDEHEALVAAVSRVLHIEGDEAATLIRVGEERIKTPLLTLLSLLNDRCTEAQKKRIVLGMWQLAFADAELAGHEEYFVRKVSQALGLNTADLVETKILAREAFLES